MEALAHAPRRDRDPHRAGRDARDVPGVGRERPPRDAPLLRPLAHRADAPRRLGRRSCSRTSTTRTPSGSSPTPRRTRPAAPQLARGDAAPRRSRRPAATATSSPTASSTAGATAVAAPVLDARGRPLAGLSLAGPTPRVRRGAPRDRARGRRGRGRRSRARIDGAVTAEPVALRAPAGAPLHATVALDGRTLTPATVAAIATARRRRGSLPPPGRATPPSRQALEAVDRGRDARLRRDDRRRHAARPAGRAGPTPEPPARACCAATPRAPASRSRPRPSARRWPSGSTSSAPAAAGARTACSTRSRPRSRAGVVPVVRERRLARHGRPARRSPHIGLALLGEGEAWVQGRRVRARERAAPGGPRAARPRPARRDGAVSSNAVTIGRAALAAVRARRARRRRARRGRAVVRGDRRRPAPCSTRASTPPGRCPARSPWPRGCARCSPARVAAPRPGPPRPARVPLPAAGRRRGARRARRARPRARGRAQRGGREPAARGRGPSPSRSPSGNFHAVALALVARRPARRARPGRVARRRPRERAARRALQRPARLAGRDPARRARARWRSSTPPTRRPPRSGCSPRPPRRSTPSSARGWSRTPRSPRCRSATTDAALDAYADALADRARARRPRAARSRAVRRRAWAPARSSSASVADLPAGLGDRPMTADLQRAKNLLEH